MMIIFLVVIKKYRNVKLSDSRIQNLSVGFVNFGLLTRRLQT